MPEVKWAKKGTLHEKPIAAFVNNYDPVLTLDQLEAWLKETVPSNWCDPMLTGKNRVIKKTVDHQDIEAVITAIRQRLLAQVQAWKKS